MTHHLVLHRLGVAAGLAFSLAAPGCSTSQDDGSSLTADTNTSTGTTAVDGTSGTMTGDTGTSTTPTSDPTTSGTSTTGGETTTGETTGETTAGETTEGTSATSGTTTGGLEPSLSFFVSSTGSMTGDLGGLEGADQRCQELADAVGAGDRTWRAYLSAEMGPDGEPVHAKDRIGAGPWYNAALVMVAADVADLHTKDGDADLFLDENGEKINGQWEGSPDPNEHDILTGTNKDGTLAVGKTCADWTSDDPALFAQVGHSDGLGPMMSDAEQYRSWNSVHESGGCHDTAPKGGSGKVYCFAAD